MKTFISILLLVSVISIGHGQSYFGPKLGFGMSSLGSSNDMHYTPSGFTPSFMVGFFYKKQFPSNFFVQIQADYRSFIGGELESSPNVYTQFGDAAIYIPVTVGSQLSYNLKWHVGGAFGLMLNDEIGWFEFLEQFNLGTGGSGSGGPRADGVIGFNYVVGNFLIDLDYMIGLIPLADAEYGSFTDKLITNQITLSLGYNLMAH